MLRLVISDWITEIENEYNNLDDVEEVIIPSSVYEIIGSFNNCKNLKKITFVPSKKKYSGSYSSKYYHVNNSSSNEEEKPKNGFIGGSFNNASIESISLPSYFFWIDSSFMNCRLLTSVYFEAKTLENEVWGVRYIGSGSFNGTPINVLEVPPSIEEIDGSFQDCKNLIDIIFKTHTNYFGKVYGVSSITNDSFRGMNYPVDLLFTLQTNDSCLIDNEKNIDFKKRKTAYDVGDEPTGNEIVLYDFGLGVIFVHNNGKIEEINLDKEYYYKGFTTRSHVKAVEDKLTKYFGMTKSELEELGDSSPFNYCVYAAHNGLLNIVVRNDCIILYLPDNPSEKQLKSLLEIISKMQIKEAQKPGYYFSFHIYNGYDREIIDGIGDYDPEERNYRDKNKDKDIKLSQLKYYLDNYYLNYFFPIQDVKTSFHK